MDHISPALEFPSSLKPLYRRALSYEWISFIYALSATLFSFLAMSNSQTMKTIWLEDFLSIIPPASFLITSVIIRWKPNKKFPYGFHRVTTAAYLTSSLALFILGIYLFLDGAHVLFKKEYPIISNFTLAGHSIWFGYVMILALLWSSLPSTVLGHIKIPLAYKLHDRILTADSLMNKASWMSGFASILGIIGIGMGFWWADALGGIIISIDIIHDGYVHTKESLCELINQAPKAINAKYIDPLINKVKLLVKKEIWVESVLVRFREEGHVLFGEIFIVPNRNVSPKQVRLLQQKIKNIHWRLHDVVIMIKPPHVTRVDRVARISEA
jgi:divalent metal cation (Fe/Co/Zn/Cd) transporter